MCTEKCLCLPCPSAVLRSAAHNTPVVALEGSSKQELKWNLHTAVHVFFELLRSADGAVDASSMVVCLI